MGQTLSSAAQWTSAHDGGRGKLEFGPVNEFILKEIVQFVAEFSGSKSDESTFVFKHPLTWLTQLQGSDFTRHYHEEGSDIVSDAVDGSGRPILVLKTKGSSVEVSVSSFEQLGFLAETAGSKKLIEARHCLEANPDPLANILGDRFTTAGSDDVAVYRLTEEIAALNLESTEERASMKLKKTTLGLLLRLKSLDSRLMRDSIKMISAEIKLSPEEVDRAFDNLKAFSGSSSEYHVLKGIVWLQPYTFVFKNGCRAPFWRQLNGDISYIVATPHDGQPIYITASTNGYFVNGGPQSKTIDLDFEKKGDYYKDLMTLLRHESDSFNRNIEKQDIFKTEERLLPAVGSSTHLGPSSSFNQLPSSTKAAGVAVSSTGDRVSSPPPMEEKLKKIMTGEELVRDGGGKPVKRTTHRKDGEQMEKKHVKIDSIYKDKQKKMAGRRRYSEESSSGSEDENNEADKCIDKFEPPADYWLIQKYMKFIRGGNQVATLIALCSMTDLNLSQDAIQLAIRDLGGIELLINLLETIDIRCKIGALRILNEVSSNCAIRHFMADLGGIQILVKLLRDENNELRCLAAETIAHVAQFKRARRIVRINGGITSLVALLDLNANKHLKKSELADEAEAARCAAMALWSCCKSRSNKIEMRRAGVVPLLSQLLWSTDTRTLIPVVGILHECASEAVYVVSIRTEGMLGNFIKLLGHEESAELQTECASALFVCAAERETSDVIRQLGGLRPLVGIISTAKDKKLLAAAAGAIWKCSVSNENCLELLKLHAVEHLTHLLENQPEEVLINVVGSLAEMARYPVCSQEIRTVNGLTPLVNLLKETNPALLANVAKAVGYCAEDLDNILIINKLEGVALIWSLLKNKNEDVQASAARALCPCIENSKDSGEMVRSFIGGLEFVVRLLKSKNPNVLASACSVIASIANDEENLAVLTDHGVVPMLAHLTCAENERQRRHLCDAIGRCCKWADNRAQFGIEDAVRPLVGYLKTKNEEVLCCCTRALHELSKDPDNCITMHDVGVVKRMLELVASRNPIIQMSAAGCMSNIRRLALANENFHYQYQP